MDSVFIFLTPSGTLFFGAGHVIRVREGPPLKGGALLLSVLSVILAVSSISPTHPPCSRGAPSENHMAGSEKEGTT